MLRRGRQRVGAEEQGPVALMVRWHVLQMKLPMGQRRVLLVHGVAHMLRKGTMY